MIKIFFLKLEENWSTVSRIVKCIDLGLPSVIYLKKNIKIFMEIDAQEVCHQFI